MDENKREKARQMRRQGASLREISVVLDIPLQDAGVYSSPDIKQRKAEWRQKVRSGYRVESAHWMPAGAKKPNSKGWGRIRTICSLVAVCGDYCQLCGRVLDEGEETVDHIVPKSRGGNSGRHNLQLMCRKCNSSKGAMSMRQAQSNLHTFKHIRRQKLQRR